MRSLILRTAMPMLVSLTLVFSMFVLFRGHNEPGGGFIGGLIAASAFALYMISDGPAAVRKALWVHPLSYAGAGLAMAGFSGFISLLTGDPFLTGKWYIPDIDPSLKYFATPVLFDIGVWLVVFGAITALALGLEEVD
ncbi:MAG: Na+/H+ antiporter subunit B [Alphaproteobacteria bacterium]